MLHPNAGARIANGRLTIRTSALRLNTHVPFQTKAFIALGTTKRAFSWTPITHSPSTIDTAALERNTVVALQPITVQAP